ncbi:BTAD domain-containing putative transcriptional regulator [Streptomyces sp. NPDC087844]|uniref:AfsR/SARP family transcriptional regulator n=1 Tax=Streptomyces sp. NPDC087844 TaxID=3365805 RepID=UPI0038293D49
MAGALRFALLGPVRAWRGDREICLGPPRRKAVLVALLLRAGAYVSPAELIDAVWGSAPPTAASASLHTHIHHLRRCLGGPEGRTDSLIRTVSKGYQIWPPSGSLDLMKFQELTAAAERCCSEGNFPDAINKLRSALGMWQGSPLSGIKGEYAERQRQLILPLRLTAIETRIAAEISSGAHADSVSELSRLVSEHPLDERFRELLMLSFYRNGRQADALDVYRQTQRALANKLGVDPGPALQRLRQQILAGEPVAVAPTTAPADRPVPAPAELPVPRQLPAPSVFFCGREAQLAEAQAAVAKFPGFGAIIAIQGAAGVGKSALGLSLAHRLADTFPDGQLYADLRGIGTADPLVTAQRVLKSFLRALGVADTHIPMRLQAQTSLLRSVLSNKRCLLFLENARDARQVRLLLPGAGGSVVVVTSREGLSGLAVREGAHALLLGPLSASESREMLSRRIGAERVATDTDAVHDLAEQCGGNPLMLSAMAAFAVINPGFTLSAIATGARNGSLDPTGTLRLEPPPPCSARPHARDRPNRIGP